ncbi:fumarylacetoacetate hydrolase family protein [Lutibaculum baratangense]|nr:fumarylacetoacetate hydrolase family protein [Lutibaculum baratangense]
MKLLRFGESGQERPAIVAGDGTVRDISGGVADLAAGILSPAGLERLAGIDPSGLPEVPAGTRIGAVVPMPYNYIGVGLNYADHAEEAGMPIPKEPILFTKAPTSLSGPNDDVVFPKGSTKGDWEVELAIVIGSESFEVPEARALDHVAGYAISNDVSERAWQLEGTGQWLKGKSAPTWGPLGPWLVTTDEVPDPQALEMRLEVNGETMQQGSTRTMIFGVAEIVSYTSRFMRLLPGDVIVTGTPPGVGMGRKPQRFLAHGDEMRVTIEGLGEQRQKVVFR